jgi:DNA-binding NtrC family response regulator
MDSSVKVLIVEDEPHALTGLAELISGWGYRTETARDGIEGWEKALAWDPAIVVTDLKMPRMDGIGLLMKLSEDGAGLNANLAVVVLTAMGSIDLAVEAMKLGAYDFLPTPPGSATPRSSWKWPAADCVRPESWAQWWATPSPCGRSSA